jgi:predicted DNA-binding transcriptional regulator YafY
MSINKSAYIRYQILDKCLRNKYRKYFIEDLLEEINKELAYFYGTGAGIKKRQLYDDLNFMISESGFSAPVEKFKEGRKVYYRYSDLNFSIVNQKITDNEISVINEALIVLSRFRGLPQFEWINELSTKLKSLFEIEEDGDIISFDHNAYLTGLDHLPFLYRCIVNKSAIAAEYKGFHMDEPVTYTIHPYYLKQYNGRWFLFGFNDYDKKLYTLPLDRISKLEISDQKYIENTIVNFSEYFEDIVGVSRNLEDKPIKIKLFIDTKTAPYILTKPLHGSQRKIKSDEKGLIIQIEVIPNFELRQLLLSYGSSVKILAPEFYKKEILKQMGK